MLAFHEIDWKSLDCAYPYMAEGIPHTLAKIQSMKDRDELGELMADLIINVNHQCDFNNSTMVVMYYLAEFIKQQPKDLDYSLTLLSLFGSFYSWEIEVSVDAPIQQLYTESVTFVKSYLLDLIANDFEAVVDFSQRNVDVSLGAFFALLDTIPYHKQIAQEFCFGHFEEVPILCTKCEFEDETLSIDDKSLEKVYAENVDWDHKDFSKTALWI